MFARTCCARPDRAVASLELHLLVVIIAVLLACVPASAQQGASDGPLGVPQAAAVDTPSVQAQADARTEFLDQHPGAQLYQHGARVTRVFGQPFGVGSSAVETAEQFRVNHARMLGVEPAELMPHSLLEDQRHSQPTMIDRQSGQPKFTLVYFSQYRNGIPVFRADLRLLVRNESGYPLVLAAANLRDVRRFAPTVNARAPLNHQLAEQAATRAVPALADFTPAQRVIWAGVDEQVVEPAVALTFVGQSAPGADPPQKWLFVIEETTGKILYQENKVLEVDVQGNVSGRSTQGPGADICEPQAMTPMAYARTSIGGTVTYADLDGDFVIPNSGSDTVTVESPVRGQYFRVFNLQGADTVLSQDIVPPGPVDFVHNDLDSSEFQRAEVNGYIHANIVRDWVLAANPSYPVIPGQTDFTVNVNSTGFLCPGNAWYDGAITFCRSGSGYPNTAWSSVVYHEYGHHVVEVGGSGQSAYGEGMSDVISVIILDDSRVGIGLFGSCSQWLRDADNNCQYLPAGCSTCGSGSHDCGQLLSGCAWDTLEQLTITEPDDYQQITMALAVNSVLLHSGTSITPQIAIDWLTLDDNDGNLDNGTPHRNEICSSFEAHSMPCPELAAVSFEYPEGRPEFVSPDDTVVIRVTVVPVGDEPVPDSGMVYYRPGGIGFFSSAPMTEVSPNEYEATVPTPACAETIEYYFSVEAAGAGMITDPAEAPAVLYDAIAAESSLNLFADNIEGDVSAWTVSSDTSLIAGEWEQANPVGTTQNSEPAAPSEDATPGAGNVLAFVTQNGLPGGAANSSDVDGGATYLMSPTIDVAETDALVAYARWSFTKFATPDELTVEVSNDGGSNWILVEEVSSTGGVWEQASFMVGDFVEPTADVRIRFTASDDDGSVTEAGIDDFRIDTLVCEVACSADLDGSGEVDAADLAILLGEWGPLGGSPADLDGNGAVDAGDLALLLGSWGPC